MAQTIKGVNVGKTVSESDFKFQINWKKQCPCCKSFHADVKHSYSVQDMLGNGVQIALVNKKNDGNLYGYIYTFCDDCNLLYNAWHTL